MSWLINFLRSNVPNMSVTNNKRFKSRAMRVLFHILPRRIKRLLFVSSLTGKITGRNELDRNTRLLLNEMFGLCKDPDAIALPLALNEKIWMNRPIGDLVCPIHLESSITEQEITRVARQIVAMMPCWLVYTGTMQIAADVRELLLQRNELFPVS